MLKHMFLNYCKLSVLLCPSLIFTSSRYAAVSLPLYIIQCYHNML